MFCEVGNLEVFFEENWRMMAEDIEHRLKRAYNMPTYVIPELELRNYLLVSLELLFNKSCSSLVEHKLPTPNSNFRFSTPDKLLQEELSYNLPDLQRQHLQMLSNLNQEQLQIYTMIKHAVDNQQSGLYFIYGHGGTGKTYLWNTLIVGVRGAGKIVLAVASSGIASLLLPESKTAHSRFKIPIAIDDSSTCQIRKGTQLARLLKQTSLILWDKAPMIHRHCLEALDKSLRDILSNTDNHVDSKPFGGKTVVLGGISEKYYLLCHLEQELILSMHQSVFLGFGNIVKSLNYTQICDYYNQT